MKWLSGRLSDSAWARILAVYVVMLIGGAIGSGSSLLDCACLVLPFVTVLMGPFVIGVWIGMLLFGPGSGMLGAMFTVILLGLQYMLLVAAFRGIVRKKRWIWGICLFAYSAVFTYVLPSVISST